MKTQEQDEQEQDEEEILSEEELEVERQIAEYHTKIEALDDRLAEYAANSLTDKKAEAMRKMNYNDDQIDRYLSHIEGETDEEIKESVIKLVCEIPPRDIYGDPSLMNPAKQKPTMKDHSEIGRKAFERVKNKIFGHGGRIR